MLQKLMFLPVRIVESDERIVFRVMDPLAEVLDVSRVRGAVLANVRAHAPWGLALPQSTGASFHALTSGTAWLRAAGAEPLQLMPGDLLLLPTGVPHRLASPPTPVSPRAGTSLGYF